MAKRVRYVKFKRFDAGDSEIISKVNPIYNTSVDRSRKEFQSYRSACEARMRAHRNLLDVLRSNTWSYFVTFTFGGKLRLDDDYCRFQFNEWREFIRSSYPDMYYVAVPEYHKKGGLHFHLVVGGVDPSDLGLVDSGFVLHDGKSCPKNTYFDDLGLAVNTLNGNGLPIFNVTSWQIGFSTATEVRSSLAVSRYISKYISKCNLDPRFYNKKRFFCSKNVKRPEQFTVMEVLDSKFSSISLGDLSRDGYDPTFENSRFGLRKYSVPLSKEFELFDN